MIIDDYGISVDFVERWKDLSYLSLSIRVLFRHSLDASFESLLVSKFNTYWISIDRNGKDGNLERISRFVPFVEGKQRKIMRYSQVNRHDWLKLYWQTRGNVVEKYEIEVSKLAEKWNEFSSNSSKYFQRY